MSKQSADNDPGLARLREWARGELERSRQRFANPTTPDGERTLGLIEHSIDRLNAAEKASSDD